MKTPKIKKSTKKPKYLDAGAIGGSEDMLGAGMKNIPGLGLLSSAPAFMQEAMNTRTVFGNSDSTKTQKADAALGSIGKGTEMVGDAIPIPGVSQIIKGVGKGIDMVGNIVGMFPGQDGKKMAREDANSALRADRIKSGTLYSKEGGKFSLGGNKGTYNGLLKGQLKELDKNTYISGPVNMTHKSGNDQPLDTDGDGIENLRMEGGEIINDNYMYSKKTVNDLKLKNKFRPNGDLIDQKTKQLNHLTARQYNDKTLAQKGMTDRMSMGNGGETTSPFQQYLNKYPQRPATDTLTPMFMYKKENEQQLIDISPEEQQRVNDWHEANKKTNRPVDIKQYYNKANHNFPDAPTGFDGLPIRPVNYPMPVMSTGGETTPTQKMINPKAFKAITDTIPQDKKFIKGSEAYNDYMKKKTLDTVITTGKGAQVRANGGPIGTGNTVGDMLYWNMTKQNRPKLEAELPSMFSKGDYPTEHYTGAVVPPNTANNAYGSVNLQRHFKTVQGMKQQMNEKALGGTMLKGNRMVNKHGGKYYDAGKFQGEYEPGDLQEAMNSRTLSFDPNSLIGPMTDRDWRRTQNSIANQGTITENNLNKLRFNQPNTNGFTSSFGNTGKKLQFDHNSPKLDFNKSNLPQVYNKDGKSTPTKDGKVGLSKGEWGALGAGAFDSAAQLAMAWKNKPHKVNYDDIASKYDYDTSKALSGLDYGEGEAVKDIYGATNKALDTTSHPSYQTRQALVNNTLQANASNITKTRGQFAQMRANARIGVAGQSADLRFKTRATKDLINTQEEDAYRQAKADALKNTSNAMYTTANTLNANQYRKDFLNSGRFVGYNGSEYNMQIPEDTSYVKYQTSQNKFSGRIKKSVKRK